MSPETDRADSFASLPEQVNWIADHLREMCDLAPPGFLHITLFITGKREAGEAAVMPGYVTIDKRDPIEGEESNDDNNSNENNGDSNASESPRRAERTGSESTLTEQTSGQGEKAARSQTENVSSKPERVSHGAVVEVRSGRPDFAEMVEREVAATEYAE